MAPSVSVGLPVFNGQATVREAISSVLAQDHADLELVISDNGSTDGTEEICRSIAREDERVKYSRLDHMVDVHLNYARAFDLAGDGEHFAWIAADDRWRSGYISRALVALRADPDAIIAVPDFEIVSTEGDHIGIHRFPEEVESASAGTRILWVLRGGGTGAVYGLAPRLTWAALVPEMLRYDATADFLAIWLSALGRFGRLKEPLVIYAEQRLFTERPPETYYVGEHRLSRATMRALIRGTWRVCSAAGMPLRERLDVYRGITTSLLTKGLMRDGMVSLYEADYRHAVNERRWLEAMRAAALRTLVTVGSSRRDRPS